MRIDILSGLPNILRSPLEESIVKKAIEKNYVEIVIHDLRKYTHDKHRTIDDTPYGGGSGMILKVEPIFECIERLKSERKYDEIIYLTPTGDKFDQQMANNLSLKENLIFLCGHYKGIDNRVIEFLITKEISIGDYVLTGGEIPALAIVDSVIRLIPGVIGDGESLLSDSFQNRYLDAPYYTKPAEYKGMKVPDVLLNGDHKKIQEWRDNQSMNLTLKRRKDLLENN
jgi:tRNA (guanine37-N1)-methyltransferase